MAWSGAVANELARRYREAHRLHQARSRHRDARSPPTVGPTPRLNQPLGNAAPLRPLPEQVGGDGAGGDASGDDVLDALTGLASTVLLTLLRQQ